jgi:DNA-binding MarR family transcriptional regulator
MREPAPEGLDELLAVSRGLLGVVARSLAPALEDVTVPQFRLIVLVSTLGPTRSIDLADRLAVTGSTLTRNVDRLVAGGWVERQPSAHSRREVLVVATDQGRELVQRVTARRQDELRTVLERVPESERATVARAAEVLRQAMSEPLPEEVSGFGA